MKPVGALSRSVGVLQRNPVIVGILFVFSLLSTVASSVQIVDPLLVYPSLGVIYLLMPFFVGGLIAFVHDGLDGAASLDRFVTAGKANYVRLLVGGLLLGVVTFVLYFVVAFVFVIGAAIVLGTAGQGIATLAPIALVGLVALLIVLLPWFFSQFFPAMIVVDGDGIADSFRRSASLVRSQFLSVVGFDFLAFAISFVAQLPTFWLLYDTLSGETALMQPQTRSRTIFDLFSTSELTLFLGSSLLVGTLVGSLLYTYYVVYFDDLSTIARTPSAADDAPKV